MRAKRMTSKNRYQQCIKIYEARREKLKVKYGKTSEMYLRHSRKINEKLKIWRQAIKRWEKRRERFPLIEKELKDFFGYSFREDLPADLRLNILGIFCRYCLEEGLMGSLIAEYCNLKKHQPARIRLKFIRSFEKHPGNRTIWNNFKDHMKKDNLK